MTLKLRTLALVTLAAALSRCGVSSSPPTTPTPAPGRWTISGTITDVAAQTPVAAARVEVVEGVNLGRAATADAQGRYQIATLEPGSFTVRAWADEFEPQTRAVTLAANQVLDFAIRRVGRTLAGTTVDALTDRAVAGVTVRVDGVGSATTAADGSFQLEASDPEVMRSVIISSPLTVERLTRLRVPGPVARLSLIPTSLDLRAFDEMFRADGGLHRWTAAPPVVLEMRVLQFTNVSDTQYTALAASMTDGDASTLIADLSWALPQLTGNAFGGFSSERRQMAAPTENVTVSRPGSIVVARYEGLTAATGFWGYTRWGWNGAGEIQSGILMLDRGFDSSGSAFRRSLRAHELGHALGYRHVTVRESVMNATARIEPNAFDRDGARIAFVRPPLNRSPDNDPDFFSGNLRYAAPLTWAGSH